MNKWNKGQEYLQKASLRGSKPGLERISQLLTLMGDPQEKMKIIHVSGTNGKGSFGAMLGSVLTCAGYRTGVFSSPAITDATDNFRINGSPVSHEILGDIICRLAPVCESLDDKPTEFEVLTAAAYLLFYEQNCQIAIVECGMGGGLDSTNALRSPLLSVITNIQKDHCGFLGNTIDEIAAHKAGIIKPGRPIFFGGDSRNIPQAIISASEKNSAPLFTKDQLDLKILPADNNGEISGITLLYKGQKIRLPLLGTYQPENAANVLKCVEILRDYGVGIPETAVISGIENAQWHGRFELLRTDPIVIFDGSHNPDGIKHAAESIRMYFTDKKIALLIGVMADKEYELYADILGDLTDRIFTVSPDNPRALDSHILAESFSKKGYNATPFSILEQGVSAACQYVESRNIPLIALGSLYMYREFTAALSRIS